MNSETLFGRMIPREPKKSQLPWSDLAVFAGVFAFLCVSLHSLFAVREAPRVAALSPPTEVPLSTRMPASQTPATTEVVRLPCLAHGPHLVNSAARLMQIHSPLCTRESKKDITWHATNESSGEEILVFVNSKEKTLSTNYFNLKEGRNDLVFVEDLGNGLSHKEIVQVTREPSAP